MPEPRFLVLRLGSLGDIVHTFPAVAALRTTFPTAEIVWLTHPRYKLLVESSSLASEIWTVDTRSLSSLREAIGRIHHATWDAAIDCQGLWKSAALPFLAGVKRRIGKTDWRLPIGGGLFIHQRHEGRPQRGGETGARFDEIERSPNTVISINHINVVRNESHVRQVAHRCGALIGRHADALLPPGNIISQTDSAAGCQLRSVT